MKVLGQWIWMVGHWCLSTKIHTESEKKKLMIDLPWLEAEGEFQTVFRLFFLIFTMIYL